MEGRRQGNRFLQSVPELSSSPWNVLPIFQANSEAGRVSGQKKVGDQALNPKDSSCLPPAIGSGADVSDPTAHGDWQQLQIGSHDMCHWLNITVNQLPLGFFFCEGVELL